MKAFILAAVLLVPSNAHLYAADSVSIEGATIKDPKIIIDLQLAALDRLIILTEATKNNLASLRQQIGEYKIKQERYLQHPDDKQQLYTMVKTADAMLRKIKDDELTDVFDVEFIKELELLSHLYSKMSLPKLQ